MTSPRQVVTLYQKNKLLHNHVREKILGIVTEEILEIFYGLGVLQQNVGLRVK